MTTMRYTDHKEEQDEPQFRMVKLQNNNSDAQNVFRPIPGLFSLAVISTPSKYLKPNQC